MSLPEPPCTESELPSSTKPPTESGRHWSVKDGLIYIAITVAINGTVAGILYWTIFHDVPELCATMRAKPH